MERYNPMITDKDITRLKQAFRKLTVVVEEVRAVAGRTDGTEAAYLSMAVKSIEHGQGYIGETWQ